jgi:alpha,alpha-trehalase
LGNGFFATRGAAPEFEVDDIHYPGTYLASRFRWNGTRWRRPIL